MSQPNDSSNDSPNDSLSAMQPTMFRPDLLKGQNILITGGGTGLGRVMAAGFASLGAEVHICGRRGKIVQNTAQEISQATGSKATGHILDIRTAEAVEDVIEQIWQNSGPLTGLVNNAAGNFISPSKDLTPRGFDAIANIVFHGSFYVTLACGKRWIKEKRPASVISILTTWIWNGGPFTTPSAMAKAGLNIMTKSLAAEWAQYHIRLNAIAPGPFPTKGAWARLSPGQALDGNDGNGASARGTPWGRNGEMRELANLAGFLMAPGCDYLTGQTIAIDGAGHLAASGNFYQALNPLSDAQWEEMRTMIRRSNEQDKAQRSV